MCQSFPFTLKFFFSHLTLRCPSAMQTYFILIDVHVTSDSRKIIWLYNSMCHLYTRFHLLTSFYSLLVGNRVFLFRSFLFCYNHLHIWFLIYECVKATKFQIVCKQLKLMYFSTKGAKNHVNFCICLRSLCCFYP